MKLGQRQWILMTALAATLAAVVWQSGDSATALSDSDLLVPLSERVAQVSNSTKKSDTKSSSKLTLDGLHRQLEPAAEHNPFAATSWYAPPPTLQVVPVTAPAEKPTAPVLPFTYVGKLEQDAGQWIVYLVKGEQSFAVSKGDTFDNVYRFEGIENGNIVITYLPLSVKQSIPIGDAAEEIKNSEKV